MNARSASFCRFAVVLLIAAIGCPLLGAYRLTVADPAVQTITDIPLSGFNTAFPASSTGTARIAAVGFDGAATGAVYSLSQPVFLPDATTATSLTLAAGDGPRFRDGDLLRVGRTGELLRVSSVAGDTLVVSRAQFGSPAGTLVDGDPLTITNRNTSFVCWYFCEQPEVDGAATIWECGRRSLGIATYAVSVVRSDGNWRIDAAVFGAGNLSLELPFSPRNRWLLISLAHVNEAAATSDPLQLSIYDAATDAVFVSAPASFTLAAADAVIPDVATIGDRFAKGTGTLRSAIGICVPAIVADAIVDGRTLGSGVHTLSIAAVANASGLSGHITLNRFQSCVWAANYSGGTLGGASNDARSGIVDGALHVLDRYRSYAPARHQFGSGATLRGGVVSIDPYAFGLAENNVERPRFDSVVGTLALPATAATVSQLGGTSASGVAGPRSLGLADALLDGSVTGRIRVGIFGNSRAVYPQSYPLRLSDGRFPGRAFKINFTDTGVLGQSPVYDNGLIVGHVGPVPWCNWTDVDLKTGEYGADCSIELPRCISSVDTAPSLALPSLVMTSLVNSTLGSRFGIFSPTATRVPSVGYPASEAGGALDNYRGTHASVRLKPGNSVRFLVRPEAGLPVTDPLVVTLYLQNHPSSSSVSARVAMAMSQGGATTWSQSVSTPGLGSASDEPPVEWKPITSVVAPVLTNQSEHARFGSVTVDDSDGAFALLEVGDLVQLADASGVTNVYNEAFSVREILRGPGGTLQISYEWLPRQFPAIGDRVTFIKGTEIIKKIRVEIPPVSVGVWRGIEISADLKGDGVLLWGFGFENPSRSGIVTVPIGRSGCGSWIQYLRWPLLPIGGGPSLLHRILTELDLDVFVMTTADQGTPGGHHVAAAEWVIDAVKAMSPDTEVVLYATGPEYVSEDTLNKSDAYERFGLFAAMQLAASRRAVPFTSFYCDAERRSSAFGRLESGADTAESPTHPGTVQDITILARQLRSLALVAPVISPVSRQVCPAERADFTVVPSAIPGTTYSWHLEDPTTPGGFSRIDDGPVVRSGVQIAIASGASTQHLTLSQLGSWLSAGWLRESVASVRCTATRAGSNMVSVAADLQVCPGDFDCSGQIDGDDVIGFFGLWDSAALDADANADGSVDGDDVISFFARWDSGC